MQNKKLFSDNYLENRLPHLQEWNEEITAIFNETRRLMENAERFGNNWSEAQTEEELIKPIFRLLGWGFVVQPKVRNKGRANRPDYALFANEEDKNAAQPLLGDDEAFYIRALVIAEAKYWGRPLSQRDSSGREAWKPESNPSHQMVNYLVGTKVSWGILTNGRIWRLYSREVSSTASEYFEVDLGNIFDFLPVGVTPTEKQINDFRLWYLFFRCDAFIPNAQGKSFVQSAQEDSNTYARQISEQLKKIVFQQVMPQIAGGFVKYRYQELHKVETPESLNEIYIASLSLLYKLLFLLYAEARNLLPMDNADYRGSSLFSISQWAAKQTDERRNISDATFATPKYDNLLALFRRVDRGDPDLGIPHYNGGLFNPSTPENIFLNQHKLSDKTVAQSIDSLVRDQGQTVDYSYISVRNLGAIYEGLLENKLLVIDAAVGQVELINDKGERKGSGSYYTPDYVVEYIVRNTVDPIIQSRNSVYEAAMAEVTVLHQKLEKTVDPALNRHLQQELQKREEEAREAFLGIKVLDPAMGSGHFLVNAVDHLTDSIIQRIQAYHDAHPEALMQWDPIMHMIDQVREGILAEMRQQGLHIDSQRLDDTALLTRLVMKRCIYGVDLNPMAVELAKVSLWLHSFTIGAPLSFLDHHLRCGNSLIGTDVRSVEKAIAQDQNGQLGLFAGPFAGLLDLTGVMTEVAERADATLADVHQSAEEYAELQRQLDPYKQILNLWVSQYFGNRLAYEYLTLQKDELFHSLSGRKEIPEIYKQTVKEASASCKEKRFFHWDLEFPEVFIDLHKRDWAENGGFDAIIGNPPYVSVTNIDSNIRPYLLSNYVTAKGRFDLYINFDEKAVNIIKAGGILCFIQPIKFAIYANGRTMREYLLQSTSIEKIVNLSQHSIFPDPTTYPCILVIRKIFPQNDHLIQIVQPKLSNPEIINNSLDIATATSQIPQKRFLLTPENVISLELSDEIWNLTNKISSSANYLDAFFIIEQCIRMGGEKNRQELILDNYSYQKLEENQKQLCKKLLDGKDIERYFINWNNSWLYYVPKRLANPKSKEVLERKKILVKRISSNLTAIPDLGDDDEYYYPLNTIYALLKRQEDNYSYFYFSALLNSKLLDWYYKIFFEAIAINGGYIEFREYLKYLPLRKIDFLSTTESLFTVRAFVINQITNNNFSDILYFAKKESKNNTNIIHEILSCLAEKMFEFQKYVNKEKRSFITWLARETSIDFEKFIGKSSLLNYSGDYLNENYLTFSQLLQLLHANQKNIGLNSFSRALQENIEREYLASLEKILPIKKKLSAIDILIDRLVYLLYDLTDEEISIIESQK
jgi:Type I restriction enzyme R protein N terminus (HSDR_N)./Eco57I restriction endonuclease.